MGWGNPRIEVATYRHGKKRTNMIGMIANKHIGMARRGTTEIEVQWARWVGASTHVVPSPWGYEGMQCKPKSPHILYAEEDRHEPSTRSRARQYKNGRNSVGVKEDKSEDSGTHTKARMPPTCT